MVTSKLLLWAAFYSLYPPFVAVEGRSCNNQCSVDELNHFWSDCCCIKCSDGGAYLNLPDGVSSNASLPWWSCCDVTMSYSMFLSMVPLFMFVVAMNFWFWFHGHAIFPTSIIELSKYDNKTNNKEENPKLECGPRDTLSGWRVVSKVTLRSTTINQREEQIDQQSGGAAFVSYDYSATIQLLGDGGDIIAVDVPLKSYPAYKQLDDYCQARQGKCYETTTTDTSHPTNGYQLITFGPANNELFLYRPYFYHSKWKFDVLVYGVLSFFITLGFLYAAPNLRTVGIVLFTNMLVLLLASVCFYFFGHHNAVGACGVFVYKSSRPNIHDYVDFTDNPGLAARPVV